jgi:N-acetyl-anhydromuramyl-L-alanine amidase AmpD
MFVEIIEPYFNWKGRVSNRKQTDFIVLHHAAATTATVVQIDQWHKGNGWSGIGYHFYVRKNGDIYRGRPIWAVGAHAQGSNSNSIGICAEGNFDTETMPQAQEKAIKELLEYLKTLYPKAEVKGHREVCATGCPGKNYPLDEMKRFYKNAENEVDAMTSEEKARFNLLVDTVEKHEERLDKIDGKMVYNYIDKNMPEWALPAVKKLTDKGYLKGDDTGLNLTDDLLRILVINDRAGLYD